MQADPLLIFSPSRNTISLEDRYTGRVHFSFSAHNNTGNPEGDPQLTGSGGPAPAGFLSVSLPDFISEDYLLDFYRRFLDGSAPITGEYLVARWGPFEAKEMGPVRFALGNPHAPRNTIDGAAWERELLIHGGGWFEKHTRGCIRMADEDLEMMAALIIKARRSGIDTTSVKIERL